MSDVSDFVALINAVREILNLDARLASIEAKLDDRKKIDEMVLQIQANNEKLEAFQK